MSEPKGNVFATTHCRWYDPQPGSKYGCLKGVDIRRLVGGTEHGWLARTPCVTSSLSYDQVPCELREYPTREEVEAFHEEQTHALEQMFKGVCPVCGKALIVRDSESVRLSACPDDHVSMRECKRIGDEP